MPDRPDVRTRASGHTQTLVALALHLAGYVALSFEREPIATFFYQWTWWTFIVAIDGMVYSRRGDSLLRNRFREACILVVLSTVIWFHFETWNLHIENWYYIRASPGVLTRVLKYLTAFGTVLPGVFEIIDLLEAYGIPKTVRVKPLTITEDTWMLSRAIGIGMVLLPLLWPTVFFPLVWGIFIFLLDPINAKWGGHSFWKDWERGDITVFCRTLLGGMIAGGLWEMWNFWARAKWIYTVPFFDELKIFEMPVLGFLGFPPFAVELMCMTTFVTLLRHSRGWQSGIRPPSEAPRLQTKTWRKIAGTAVVYVVVQMWLTEIYIVGSRHQTIRDSIWGLTAEGQALADAGFRYPEDVARGLTNADQRLRVAKALDWPNDNLEVAAGPILIAALPEVGPTDAYVLTALDIFTLDRLARADPKAIAKAFPRQTLPNGKVRGAPPERRARVWVKSAQRELASWPKWRRALSVSE